MKLSKSLLGLASATALTLTACGKAAEPAPTTAAAAPAPEAAKPAEAKPDEAKPEGADAAAPRPTPQPPAPTGPVGLLEVSPAEEWGNNSLWVMLTDVAVKPATPAPRLSFEILVLDRENPGEPSVESLDPKDLALTLDGLYVPGTWEVVPFRETGRGVALGLLVNGHWGYAAPIELDGRTWSPFEALREATRSLIPTLGDQDRVALFGLTEEEFKVVRGFGPPAGLAELVASLPAAGEAAARPPAVYRSIRKALSHFQENAADLPSRRILLLASDGLNTTDKPAVLAREIDEVAELAQADNISPWLIGYTPDGADEALVNLNAMASRSYGRYVALESKDYEKLGERFAALAREARGGFVVTLTPAAGVRLPESAQEVRLALRSGERVGRATHHRLTIGR